MEVINPGKEVWVRGRVSSVAINNDGDIKYYVKIPHWKGKEEFEQGVYVGTNDMLYDIDLSTSSGATST